MKKLRTVLVEDEQNNMNLLNYFIENNFPSLEIVSKIYTYEEAKVAIENPDFDLLFLDIHLGKESSLTILEGIERIPFHIIFTTAYDIYAIKAFRFNATDYLLKPIILDELKEAVKRVEVQIQDEKILPKVQLEQLSKSILKKQQLNFITVSGMDRVDFIHPDDIVYLKSSGRYTQFYLKDKKRKIISSRPIGSYENMLDKEHFYRIHNSFLINLNALINIDKRAGNYCELINGDSLPISRRRFEGLVKMMHLK